MPFIEVTQPEEAEGRLKEIYEEMSSKRGKLAEIHKIQSLNPESIMYHMNLYMHLMFGKSPLKRWQREMMAVVVSVTNQCEYCREHHLEALRYYWKDEAKLNELMEDFYQLDLNKGDIALCKLARQLTKEPYSVNMNEDQYIQPLRDAGLTDKAILDATMIISYFNFVNRLVLGLGVESSKEEATGYNY